MALDVAECDQIIDACHACRGPADDRQADPPHGDVDAGQGVHRRGADRRDPVPPADERDARHRASPTSRRAGRPIRARATPSSTGEPTPATPMRWFTGAEPVRVYADYDNFTGLPLESPTAMVQIRLSSRAIAQILLCVRDRTVRVRDAAQQPVPDRRHGGLDLLGPRPGRAATPAARDELDVGAAELDPPRLQAT